MKFHKLERVDKGNISDTEFQIGTFTLGQAENFDKPCAEYTSNAVNCQASNKCGWCNFDTIGACYDPKFESGCLALEGSWVGPHSALPKATPKEIQQFVDVQIAQLQGVDSLKKEGKNSFLWTVPKFHEISGIYRRFQSPWFEVDGAFWRIWVKIHGSRYLGNNRLVGINIERGYPKDSFTQINVEGQFVHPLSPSKTMSIQGISLRATPDIQKGIDTGTISIATLMNSGYIQNDSIQVRVTLTLINKK